MNDWIKKNTHKRTYSHKFTETHTLTLTNCKMQPVSKTLKPGPLIKLHSFDEVCCIVGCDARLVLFFQTPVWQTLPQSQRNIFSDVVSGKVCCLQAATFQLKVVIYEMAKIRSGRSAWPHISSCFSHWGKKIGPMLGPDFFYLVLLIKSRPDLTTWLWILSFGPCSPRHAAHQLSKYNAATGGFVSIHIIIPPCYFVVPQNTLKQLESHILMPPYAPNTASRPMETKQAVLPPSL